MTDTLMIVRSWSMSCFCLTALLTALNAYVSPSKSFADVPLLESPRMISPSGIRTASIANPKSNDLIADNSMSAGEIGWPGFEARGDHERSIENWVGAEKAYAIAVGLLDRTTDKEVNEALAALLNKLGVTRFKQGDFAGAETAFRRALTIYTMTRGAENLHVADTLDLVASALFEQEQGRALAGPLFYRAWVIREEMVGPEHPAIADSLHHVAVSLYADNLSLAIPLFLRSRQIREKVFGHDHPLVANSLNAMARLYELHNRQDLAVPLYQDALTIQEKVFGPNASETREVRSSLDMAHRRSNHLHEDPQGR